MNRIDIISQNGNEGTHYRDKCSGCMTTCKQCKTPPECFGTGESVDDSTCLSCDFLMECANYGSTPELATEPLEDVVNSPRHYTSHPSGIEVIQITESMGFCLGNVIKYVLRADHKGNRKQDLEKAMWYLQRELNRE